MNFRFKVRDKAVAVAAVLGGSAALCVLAWKSPQAVVDVALVAGAIFLIGRC